jgi:hypothetical protein
MTTPLQNLAADFARRAPPGRAAGTARYDGGVFYSYNEPIAKILAPGKAWVTATKFSVTTSKHTGAVLHALHVAGYDVTVSNVPPSPDAVKDAPMPPITRDDAGLVAAALRSAATTWADEKWEGQRDRQLHDAACARAKALAAVFEAAARGEGGEATGLFAAMQVSGG